MIGLLLDTNALAWLLAGEAMTGEALVAIGDAQRAGRPYVSTVSAWEAAVALRKPDPRRRPNLGGRSAEAWFRSALNLTGVRLVPVGRRIALEAARVPDVYGRGDPGDCFLIATARVKKVPIVTRDEAMRQLAARLPAYLEMIEC